MALFRFHRGSLDESLKTTIVVKSIKDLMHEIALSMSYDSIKDNSWGAAIEINPYPAEESNFDKRIGWYTHIVLCNLYEADKMHPVGFLSEPLTNRI